MKAPKEILKALRAQGIGLRRTAAGALELSHDNPIPDAVREKIMENKEALLAELAKEAEQAIKEAAEKAREILAKSTEKPHRGIATAERDGVVYVSCAIKGGQGWSLSIPEEAWDPWRLAGAIMSAAPGKETK